MFRAALPVEGSGGGVARWVPGPLWLPAARGDAAGIDRPRLLRVADLLGLARAAQLAGPGLSMEWGRTWGRLGCDRESVARRGHLPG